MAGDHPATDEPDWIRITSGSTTNSGLRSTGEGLELGKFAAGTSETLTAAAPIGAVTPTVNQSLFASFDVTMDRVNSGAEPSRLIFQIRSETEYAAAPASGVSLWLDAASSTPLVGLRAFDEATTMSASATHSLEAVGAVPETLSGSNGHHAAHW